jgi:hypothetical protein
MLIRFLRFRSAFVLPCLVVIGVAVAVSGICAAAGTQTDLPTSSGILTLLATGENTKLELRKNDVKVMSLILKRDATVQTDASVIAAKIIGEKGQAIILTDSYASKGGGLSYCASGEEEFLRVISVDTAELHERLNVKLSSCRDNIELAGPVQWEQSSGILEISWLGGPPKGEAHLWRIYKVLENGQILDLSPSPFEQEFLTSALTDLRPVVAKLSFTNNVEAITPENLETARRELQKSEKIIEILNQTSKNVCEVWKDQTVDFPTVLSGMREDFSKAAVKLASVGVTNSSQVNTPDYQEDLARQILRGQTEECNKLVLTGLISRTLPEKARNLLPERYVERVMYLCAEDRPKSCGLDERHVCIQPARAENEFDVSSAKLEIALAGGGDHDAEFEHFAGDDPAFPGRSKRQLCLRLHTAVSGGRNARVDAKVIVREKIASGNPTPVSEFEGSMAQARRL